MGLLIGTLVTFFVAPFIIADYLIYGCKIAAGSIKSARNDILTRNRLEPWLRLVTSKQLESEVWDMIKNTDRAGETEKELNQILQELPFLDKRLRTTECVIGGISYMLAHMLLMAKRGKLSEQNATSGINAREAEDHSTVENSGALLMFWINKQLKNHGVDECMMQEFESASGANSNKIYKIRKISDVRSGLSRKYRFRWNPSIEEWKRGNIVD